MIKCRKDTIKMVIRSGALCTLWAIRCRIGQNWTLKFFGLF